MDRFVKGIAKFGHGESALIVLSNRFHAFEGSSIFEKILFEEKSTLAWIEKKKKKNSMDRLLCAITPTKLDESRKNDGIREITGSRACFHREKNVEPSATK